MKIPTTGDNGAQPREFVLQRLIDFGIGVLKLEDDWFEITDRDGDMEVMWLTDPVTARQVIHLWRRFGCHEGMLQTDFVDPKTKH